MFRVRTIASTIAGLLSTGLTLADGGGAAVVLPLQPICGFRQPWDQQSPAHLSRVDTCDNPVPLDRVALDDFIVDCDGDARRLRWWGILLDPQQAAGRPYYVAIYSDSGNCEPDALLYETCVVPQVQQVGMDCTNRNVFVFRANIPPFAVTAGEHYWLQISEIDAASANVGQDDFAWSGRQPVRGCPAVQLDADGGVHGPLHNVCNENFDDLSFAIAIFAPPGAGND